VTRDPELLLRGRTFRDVAVAEPGELRARQKAAPHEIERV
jgi:hypothetical protein